MTRFALTGLAGYVAPRHLRAILDTGHRLVAAADVHDSVGVVDGYFPDAAFFTEHERFDRHLEKLRRQGEGVDVVSVCSPNYLHDAHVRLALRVGADALCEKPLVLNPWNLDALAELEREYGRRVWTVLQLRTHPALAALKEQLSDSPDRPSVRLTYVAPRGRWYRYSWKGDVEKSGGIATNIGVHLFDLVLWLFGPVESQAVHLQEPERAAGRLALARADVEWFLSVDVADRPRDAPPGPAGYRAITVDGRDVEFSEGLEHLHTKVYRRTLAGDGFGIDDARPSIELVHAIRQSAASSGAAHPFAAGGERTLAALAS